MGRAVGREGDRPAEVDPVADRLSQARADVEVGHAAAIRDGGWGVMIIYAARGARGRTDWVKPPSSNDQPSISRVAISGLSGVK